MIGPKSARVSKWPLALLGLMTVASFGGPFGVGWVLSGGARRGWPPDRPVEWAALIGTVGLAAALLIAILALGLANLKAMKAEAGETRAES